MPTLVACASFDYGLTFASWILGVAGSKIFDTSIGSSTRLAVTTSPRTGTRCLEIANVADSSNIQWDTGTFGAAKTHATMGMGIYLPSTLPAGATDIVQVQPAAGAGLILRFNGTGGGSNLTIGFEGFTFAVGPVLSANTWYWVDFHVNMTANPHTIEWAVDGITRTPPANQAQAASTVGQIFLGSTNAQTATVRYDDIVLSVTSGDYPLGKHKVILLTVDPAGTVTLSGTSTNWSTFAGATPTLTAWNVTTARDAVDEVPPNTTASQDGFCVTTGTAGTEYASVPMTSYTLQAGETISGVRLLACGWQAAATAASLGIRSYNGTTETIVKAAAAQTALGNNTATPGWICGMCTLADFDTQAELDALEFRVGYSTDVTPSIGVQALYAEVAVKESLLPDVVMAPMVSG